VSVPFRRDVFGANATLRVDVALGADVYANPAVWTWTDITADVLQSQSGGLISITPMGRSDEYSTASPAGCSFALRNSNSSFGAGTWTAYNPTSQFYPYVRQNTPVRVVVNLTGVAADDSVRFQGYVYGWKPGWDTSGRNSIVTVSASGISRRGRQGNTPSQSPIYRSTLAARPVMYAPMEEEVGATTITVLNADGTAIANAVFGGNADPGTADTTLLGSKTGAKLLATSYLNMNPEKSPATAKFTNHWQIDWFMYFPSEPAAETIVMRGYSDSAQVLTVDAVYGGGVFGIRAYGSGGSVAGSAIFGVPTFGVPGQWTHWRLMAHAASGGTDTDYQVVVFPINGAGSFAPLTVASAVPGNNRGAGILPQAGLAGVSMAHWAIYNRYNYSAVDSSADGYTGESASTRITRICREERIPLALTGSSAVTMGPQPISTAPAVLRECEAADGGVLYDGRSAGYTYVSHSSRYNQTAALTLDASVREVTGSPDTYDDDQRRLNRATISRSGGGSATLEQVAGPLGSAAIGLYDTSRSMNIERDDQLYQQAAWLVHLGQADGFRHPRLSLDLVGTAALTGSTSVATEWLASAVASRIDVTNTRTKAPTRPPGDVRLLLEGWSETLGPKVWTVAANCSNYEPWAVGALKTGTPEAYLDCGASVLVSAPTSGSTTIDVGVNDSCNWTHGDGDYFISVGGEDMKVTAAGALTSSAPTFIAAGTAASADGASTRTVTPGLPAGMSAGNLMLLLASCRDTNSDPNLYLSGVSVQDGPTAKGWQLLLDARNVALFAKVHSGSETAPTVNIDSTIFGDSIVAQMCAFSGKWGDPETQLIAAASTLNGSAQDISYPALPVPLGSVLIIWMGWKADDWTSVATLGGVTEIGEPDTVLGNDAGIVWDYNTSVGAPTVGAGSFVVTGGSTAISRGAVVALCTGYQTLTVTRAQNGTVAKAHILGEQVLSTQPLLPSRD
jgi:hypothetical protein